MGLARTPVLLYIWSDIVLGHVTLAEYLDHLSVHIRLSVRIRKVEIKPKKKKETTLSCALVFIDFKNSRPSQL